MFVQQVPAFTTTAFGDQHTSTGDTGRVELPHLHILHRDARADRHANAVTGVDVGVRGGLINTACAASRQHRCARFEINHFTGFNAQRGTPDHCAIFIFHQIECIPLGENSGVVFQVLLIQRVQQSVTGTVSRCRGTCRLLAAEVFRLAAKRTLINGAIIQTGEWQAHVVKLENRFRAGLAHIFNGVLVTDIVGAFHRVIHVPFPVIFMGITERNGDATLGRNRMRAGWENF